MSAVSVEARPNRQKSSLALLVFAVAHAAAFLSVVWLVYYREPAFQVGIFRDYADRIFAGEVPYSDFSYEYPPLSLFILAVPRLFTADPELYATLFGAEMLLFDLAILWTLSRIGWKPLALYGTGILLFWRLPYIRHDLAPVAAVTLGTLFLLRGRALLCSALWGVGGALKLYPMAGVPALAAGASLAETTRRWSVAGAVFAAGILWGVAAFGPEALRFLVYHADRPAMIESLPANILLLLPGSEVTHGFGSYNVLGPLGDELAGFFEIFQLAATVAALLAVWWRSHGLEPPALAIRGAAAATFAFAVFGKVLSPHFLFWPLPLLAVATALGAVRYPKIMWAVFFSAIALTELMNEQYWAITEDLPYFTALLTVRNLLLLPLFVLILLPPHKPDKQSPK